MPEQTRTVIVGMGEIGGVFYEVLKHSKSRVYGVDKVKQKSRGKTPKNCDVLHICIPYHKDFIETVRNYVEQYAPKEVVLHSSVPPTTTVQLSNLLKRDVVYSPFRGVHKRMGYDMLRYTKYWAGNTEPSLFIRELREAKVKVEPWNDSTVSLELAKLLEVVYYGWLIIWAQHKKVLADRYGVDDEKLWQFTDEVHNVLGNRPRMFAGEGIGGHCVMQDKDLLNDAFLDSVFSHDQFYRRNLKNGK